MRISPIPYLAAANGPSHLLRAVIALVEARVPPANWRLQPVIREFSCPEVVPYSAPGARDVSLDTLFLSDLQDIWPDWGQRVAEARNQQAAVNAYRNPRPLSPKTLAVSLGINVRPDNRLQDLLPLLEVGLVSSAALRDWEPGKQTLLQVYRQEHARLCGLRGQYLASLREGGEDPTTEWELEDRRVLDWTNIETPPQYLARLLCQQFPEWAEFNFPLLLPSQRRTMERADSDFYIMPRAAVPPRPETQQRTLEAILEIYFTWIMRAIASADMRGGFVYVLGIAPQGRKVAAALDGTSTPQSVARWANLYPHYPLPIQQGAAGSAGSPATPYRWTDREPGIQLMAKAIRELYRGERPVSSGWCRLDRSAWQRKIQERKQDATGRQDTTTIETPDVSFPVPPEELLALAWRYLPGFVPNYPHQSVVTGGTDLEELLLSLLKRWRSDSFLGLSPEVLKERFPDPIQQEMLDVLLVQRTSRMDQCGLFQAAVRLLIGDRIDIWLEPFDRQDIVLGQPLAQLGATLALGTTVALHAPTLMIRISMDRTDSPVEALERAGVPPNCLRGAPTDGAKSQRETLEPKLDTLISLFVPVHIPIRKIWDVDWAELGKTAYLQHSLGAHAHADCPPVSRLHDDLSR